MIPHVHSKATTSSAAVAHAREKLAQFEHEQKVKANDDNPLKVALKEAEHKAALAKRDQEIYNFDLRRGVNPMMMEREELEVLEHEEREKEAPYRLWLEDHHCINDTTMQERCLLGRLFFHLSLNRNRISP